MTQQLINIGAAPYDGTGDQLRVSFDKCNQNFTELYTTGAGTSTEGVWNFNQTSTDTTTSPTSGRFRSNSGNAASATQLAIHRISVNGFDRADTLRTQHVGDIIKLQDKADATSWARFIVQATPVDNVDWFQIDVAFDSGGGTAPGNNQEILFTFAASSGGGGGGGNVSNVGTPTNGQIAQWTDATHIQGVAASTITAGFQPLDADLTAIAALSGTNTIYYRSGANIWSPVTIGANLTFASGTLAATGGGFLDNYLTGLGISNNGSDVVNDIDIAVGIAADTTNVALMRLSSALTKRLDAAWAVGTNQGGLDTGAVADGTYHIWLIQRSDTSVVDVLFSLSASAPSLPTNYDRKRRIGAIIRVSAAILLFTQQGAGPTRFIRLATPPMDVNVSNLATSAASIYTMTLPAGISVLGLFNAICSQGSAAAAVYVRHPNDTDSAASTSAAPLFNIRSSTVAVADGNPILVACNTSSQIAARSSVASTTLRIVTLGWWEYL